MMRVFVLCTGRCGSLTFATACKHIDNFTVGHESGAGVYSLDYPDNHIEVDNRLSWFPGLLAQRYPDARYVWLRRNEADVVSSFTRRFARSGIMYGFCRITQRGPGHKLDTPRQRRAVAAQYVRTVEANIAEFLRRRPVVEIWIDHPLPAFLTMWRRIGARGDMEQAIKTLRERHNAS